MLKPSDFKSWKYWALYEWREWNPYELGWKVTRFVKNILAYREILWHDSDWDYVYLLKMMELKLRRMGQHFTDHGHLVASERVARECRVASALCRRLRNDDYLHGEITRASVIGAEQRKQADLEYLTRLIRRKLLCWWD